MSLVNFQHEKKKSAMSYKLLRYVTFNEKWMFSIKHVSYPGRAISGLWPPFWATSFARSHVRTFARSHVRTFARSHVRTRPRAMPLATITIKTQTHGFPISVHARWGAPL